MPFGGNDMDNANVIVRCANLRKSFLVDAKKGAQLEVLKGISLEILRGDFVSIVGASGSGKSTLLHILGGLDRPSDGEVWWSEENIFDMQEEKLAQRRAKEVGFVFQFHHLMPEFTALENVMIPQMILRISRNEARQRAEELLRLVGLADRLHQRPVELSGGEQQRVAVARALANRPTLVFADEPSGNLDSDGGEQLHNLLLELNRSAGQTFVVVTHNERFADRAKRIFRMSDGILKPV